MDSCVWGMLLPPPGQQLGERRALLPALECFLRIGAVFLWLCTVKQQPCSDFFRWEFCWTWRYFSLRSHSHFVLREWADQQQLYAQHSKALSSFHLISGCIWLLSGKYFREKCTTDSDLAYLCPHRKWNRSRDRNKWKTAARAREREASKSAGKIFPTLEFVILFIICELLIKLRR